MHRAIELHSSLYVLIEKMRNEGLFLVAFIILAVVLLVMVTKASREHFDPPMDPILRTSKLEEDVKLLDERTTKLEDSLEKQNTDIDKAQSDVDTAATQIQMVT